MFASLTEPQVFAILALEVLGAFVTGFGACWLFHVRPALLRELLNSERIGHLQERVGEQNMLLQAAYTKLAKFKRPRDAKGRMIKRKAVDQSPAPVELSGVG